MTDAEIPAQKSGRHFHLHILLERLAQDHPDPGARYEYLRQKLIRYFAWEQGGSPEDLADSALDRLSSKVAENEPIRNLDSYLAGIARLIAKEDLAQRRREETLTLELGRRKGPGDAAAQEKLLDELDGCLQGLRAEERNLLLRYYRGDGQERIQTRQKLANQLGISMSALRNRVWRIRESVDACMGKRASPTNTSPEIPTKGKRKQHAE